MTVHQARQPARPSSLQNYVIGGREPGKCYDDANAHCDFRLAGPSFICNLEAIKYMEICFHFPTLFTGPYMLGLSVALSVQPQREEGLGAVSSYKSTEVSSKEL